MRKRRFSLILLVLLATSWVLLQSTVRLLNYGDFNAVWSGKERFVLDRDRFPGGPLFRALQTDLKPDERTLVFRQSDFTLYGSGRWLADWDTAAEPLYRLATAAAAFQWLRERNIRFALLPGYLTPTYYRTAVGAMLSDPRYVEIVGEHRGYRLLRLLDRPAGEACAPVDLTGLKLRYVDLETSFSSLAAEIIGIPRLGRPTLLAEMDVTTMLTASEDTTRDSQNLTLTAEWPPAHHFRISMGGGSTDYPPYDPQLQLSRMDAAVRASLVLTGRGLVKIDVLQYLSNGEVTVSQQWDGVVDQHRRTASILFRPDPKAVSFRIALENLGRTPGAVSVASWSLCRVIADRAMDSPSPASQKHEKTLSASQAQQRTSWSIDAIQLICGETHRRIGGKMFAYERDSKRIRILSEQCLLKTPASVVDWKFLIRSISEPWRLHFERHPESRLAELLLPILYRFIVPAPPSTPTGIQAKVRARGDGGITAFVQWRDRDGTIQSKLAGSALIDEVDREISLPTTIPSDAGPVELVVQVKGAGIELKSLAVERDAPFTEGEFQ